MIDPVVPHFNFARIVVWRTLWNFPTVTLAFSRRFSFAFPTLYRVISYQNLIPQIGLEWKSAFIWNLLAFFLSCKTWKNPNHILMLKKVVTWQQINIVRIQDLHNNDSLIQAFVSFLVLESFEMPPITENLLISGKYLANDCDIFTWTFQ